MAGTYQHFAAPVARSWPFICFGAGKQPVWPHLYYGFFDCEGHTPGFATQEELLAHLEDVYEFTVGEGDVGFGHEDLGGFCATVLTGAEYVTRCRELSGDLNDYGYFGGIAPCKTDTTL